MEFPKVLVGCPTSIHKKYCIGEYWDRLSNLTYPNYDVLLVDNSKDNSYLYNLNEMGVPAIKSRYFKFAKDRVVFGRNLLREKVLKGGYDYFLSLEQDVIPPRGVIERFLWRDKKIISGLVFHLVPRVNDKGQKYLLQSPLLGRYSHKEEGKISFFDTDEVLIINSMVDVDYCSMGCLFIHKDVLRQIKFRYEEYGSDDEDSVYWDDICFCKDVKKLGHNIYADLGVKCRHRILGGYSISIGDTSKIEKLKRIK